MNRESESYNMWCLIDDQSGFVLGSSDVKHDVELMAKDSRFDMTRTDIGFGKADEMGVFIDAKTNNYQIHRAKSLSEPDDLFSSKKTETVKDKQKSLAF